MLKNKVLQSGLTSFGFQYFLQAGLFFVIPLFLSVALGLSAIETGVRLLPLSVTLLLAAAGIPKLFPKVSPRKVVRLGFFSLFAGLAILVGALEAGAGAEIVTWPLLLAGLGIGALASQLGSVTVSSVPDEQSGEVGGVQNTVTNLGASIGTALAGAVLISALTTSFFGGIQDNPDVPDDLASEAQVELASGIPFISDADLEAALDDAGVPPKTADAVVEENADARIAGLRTAVAVLALVALIATFFARRIPTQQPSEYGSGHDLGGTTMTQEGPVTNADNAGRRLGGGVIASITGRRVVVGVHRPEHRRRPARVPVLGLHLARVAAGDRVRHARGVGVARTRCAAPPPPPEGTARGPARLTGQSAIDGRPSIARRVSEPLASPIAIPPTMSSGRWAPTYTARHRNGSRGDEEHRLRRGRELRLRR